MKSKKQIFKEHYERASGRPCDEMVLHHMNYAMDAMDEFATQPPEEENYVLLDEFTYYRNFTLYDAYPQEFKLSAKWRILDENGRQCGLIEESHFTDGEDEIDIFCTLFNEAGMSLMERN